MDSELDAARERELAQLVRRFCEEIRSGGTPSIEAYAAEHPELAELVRETFPALELLETCGRRHAGDRQPEANVPGTTEGAPCNVVALTLRRFSARAAPLDRYRIEDEIGRGGQGIVLSVWDEDLRRNLAMKVLRVQGTQPGSDPEARSLGRFLEEAHLTAQLDHPGIVPVHELGLDSEARVYFTMKLVKGRDLRTVFELVRRGEEGWSRTRALSVLLKVCEAMAYAHSKGVIHRDLKPSNVMVGKFGEVYVMDWGLARVLGSEDRKDLRIRPDVTSALHSLRREASDDLDSPLVTMDGDVVGTPAYMSPEQARGELAAMGPHSDVYAVGAILYHLLTGQMPYVPSGGVLGNRTVWALVQKGPPEPVHTLAVDVPPELAAICDKAMRRDVAARYADMGALAEDLRAYLEHRVVRAYRTGALVELRKWIARNKSLAAAIAAALVLTLGGLGGVSFVQARGKRVADAERVNVLRLSGLQEVKELEELAKELWPPSPEHEQAYRDWLHRAERLVASLDPDPAGTDIGHRARIASLRTRALLYTDEDREADRLTHPRFPERRRMDVRIDALERAQAVRLGKAKPPVITVDEAEFPDNGQILNEHAWSLVNPETVVPAELGRGMALARLAVARPATDDDDLANRLDTLAWACFMNGLDEEALVASERALRTATEARKTVFGGYLERLKQEIEAARSGATQQRLREEEVALEAELARRRTWRFEIEQDRWLHAQLVELVASIEALADPATGLIGGVSPTDGLGIERRLAHSESLAERTMYGAEAAGMWTEAIASISDPNACPEYGGLVLEPQFGFLPIGRDPGTKLWEFVHPQSGDAPERAVDGKLTIVDSTGLIFVLLPGGTFSMGAQRKNPEGSNYDPLAEPDEFPVQQITLAPFFLSKYEMTQGQWLRSTGTNPSQFAAGSLFGSKQHTLLHPVEDLSWPECMQVVRRLGLTLPTEAQWEYAARAGTTTSWWTGSDPRSMEGAGNLADVFFRENAGMPAAGFEEWNDGYAIHAPVGTYRSNPFGLQDMLGNVWEWCLDEYGTYWTGVLPSNGARMEDNPRDVHAFRGGGFNSPATVARCARRIYYTAEPALGLLGLRPAMEIRRSPAGGSSDSGR